MSSPRDHSSPTVHRLLGAVKAGDRSALNDLYALVYDELRVLARRQRRGWDDVGTLNTAALVHEAYLKLAKRRPPPTTQSHFFALAATAMRHIVSNYARDRQAKKRGGDVLKVPLDGIESGLAGGLVRVSEEHVTLLVALDEALDRLDRVNPRQRSVVECRFFGGLSVDETAAAIGVGERTVKRDWALAQAWLYREMKGRS